jgi:pimeloyl-ACP methyl ester carboxylesterase/DNA-binding CsgD family transcriptional regulator
MSENSDEPAIRYARTSDGLNIAFCTLGDGPPLVHMPGFPASHLRRQWEVEACRDYLCRLASDRLVVLYDPRGTGLSERIVDDLSMEGHLSDLEAVVEAAGAGRFALVGLAHLGPTAIRYAALHPERVTHLVIMFSYARAPEYAGVRRVEAGRSLVERDWELYTEMGGKSITDLAGETASRQYTAYLRESNTARGTVAAFEAIADYDATEWLSQVRCPTLVLQRRQSRVLSTEVAHELAAGIPDARVTVVEGRSLAPFIEDADRVISAIRSFLDEGLQGGQLDGLTPREIQVLRLIARGRSNREIAVDLVLSERTVARHIANIYTKTGIHSKSEATAYAFRHDLSPEA